jgi:MFS family permease
MSVARGCVGFVAFFLAFALRHAHASTWWFGALLVASGAGSLLGSILVPRLRRYFSERSIIILALTLIAVGALGAGLIGGRWAQIVLTFVVGIGPTGAKASLDSIVQRQVPPALLGRTFGRIETRLQLVWVIASLCGVLITFPLRIGDGVVAVVCVFGLLVYVTSGPRSDRVRPAGTFVPRRP